MPLSCMMWSVKSSATICELAPYPHTKDQDFFRTFHTFKGVAVMLWECLITTVAVNVASLEGYTVTLPTHPFKY